MTGCEVELVDLGRGGCGGEFLTTLWGTDVCGAEGGSGKGWVPAADSQTSSLSM